jgi:aspartyl-tRNA(Asn)/glutamyl-tRNA(Gln) amidotransferase subunit A
MSDLTRLTIAEARAALDNKDCSAVELTDAYIAAMEAHRDLNAYIVETPDKAREMARASDQRIAAGKAGPLEGIPLGIKDLFATEGVHTQACSHILDGFRPPYESTVTANLWRDGAVMLGKLNMDEFAMGSSNETSYYGPVKNPWKAKGDNKDLVPGGSSGGSAAAVAAGFAPAPPQRIPAARSASRRPSPAPSVSSPPMAAVRAGASSPSPLRWIRPVRLRVMCATAPSC